MPFSQGVIDSVRQICDWSDRLHNVLSRARLSDESLIRLSPEERRDARKALDKILIPLFPFPRPKACDSFGEPAGGKVRQYRHQLDYDFPALSLEPIFIPVSEDAWRQQLMDDFTALAGSPEAAARFYDPPWWGPLELLWLTGTALKRELDARADIVSVSADLLTDLRKAAVGLENALGSEIGLPQSQPAATKRGRSGNDAPQYVTLDQIALIAGYKGKRTPQRWIQKGEMPEPSIEGGGGKAAQWIWSDIRPWLMLKTKKQLPERYPTLLG
jgi:hypothetical protein